ncbi:MAG TPA: AraC family transcriptional regulator, partial [Thermoleophilaceae bacterium]
VAGDLYVIAPDDMHDGRDLGTTRGWMLGFMPDALLPDSPSTPGYTPLPGDPRWLALRRTGARRSARYVVPPRDRGRWSQRFAEIRHELRARRLGYQHAVRAHLGLLLIATTRAAMFDGPPVDPTPDPVQEMIEVIDARYAEPLSVGDVAQAVASSPSHLGRMAKRVTGVSIRQWIEERRMQEARRLLLETDQSIDLIARTVGFHDVQYFRRRFRRAHGMPPQTWRERNR